MSCPWRRVQGRGLGRGRGCRLHNKPDGQRSQIASPVDIQPVMQSVGPTFSVSSDPTEVFLTLFTPELLEFFVREINQFATLRLLASHGAPLPGWTASADEMNAFSGLTVLNSLTKLPTLYDYWSSSELLHLATIASRIPRKCYLELRRFVHFVDNSTLPAHGEERYDWLGKLHPVTEAVREYFLFLSFYSPHCECSIDEVVVKFKGRSSLKQYLPNKASQTWHQDLVRAQGVLKI